MAGEQLRITGGPAAGSQLEVGQELQIGRSAGGEGRLGDDPEISRQHAKIARNPQGQLVVEDLGSTNGTYVNGQRIAGPTTLNPGDTVQMGRSTLSVEGGAAGGQATAIGAVPAGFAAPPPPPPAPPPPGPPAQALPPTGQQPAFAQGPGGPGAPPPPVGYGGPGPGGAGGGRNNGRIALIAGLVAAVIVVGVVLALVLSGGDDKKKSSSNAAASTPTTFTMDTSKVTTTAPPTTSTDSTSTDPSPGGLTTYPPNVKTQFVKGCHNGGGSTSACQCTIDEIEKKYDLIEFLDLIQQANKTGKFPPAVQSIIKKCANA
jgi:hypothetical protein